MENKNKSSDKKHSKPLQQCSVINRFSFDEHEPEIGAYIVSGLCEGKELEVQMFVSVPKPNRITKVES